jgi:EmrB/QacA subfamily drug resistance transporter
MTVESTRAARAPDHIVRSEHLSRRRLIVVTLGVMMSLLLAALDQTIVGTAMPHIVTELNGLDRYAWVITAYLVSSTLMVPISGKLGDLFGRKPFLITGMAGFVAASALCGLAGEFGAIGPLDGMTQLVLFRTIQGLFGGTLFATVFAVIADLYPPAQRARLQGLFGGVWGLASVFGPTAGGYITDNFTWRWVFYINLPLGIAAILVVLFGMPFVRSRASWRDIDFAGAAALAASLIPLLIGLSITTDHAWTSPEVLGLLGLALVMAVVFFLVEQRTDHPIVPFSLFRIQTFTVSVLIRLVVTFGMFGAIAFIPLVFQGVLGIPATNSGLFITPMMFGLIFASIVTGQLMVRIARYRYIGTVGIAVMALGMWLLAQVTISTPEIEVVRDLVIVGLGLGTTLPLYLNAVQSAVPRNVMGVATSQIQFWQNIGGTIGTAVLGSLLARRLPEEISAKIAGLNLPPQVAQLIPHGNGAASAQQIFEPARIAQLKATLPPAVQPVVDQVILAIREALATTLSEIFLVGAAVVLTGVVLSVFLEDVPLRGRERVPEAAPAFGD